MLVSVSLEEENVMKKILSFIFAVLSVLFMQATFTGTAEAARVAVVPIQTNDK